MVLSARLTTGKINEFFHKTWSSWDLLNHKVDGFVNS